MKHLNQLLIASLTAVAALFSLIPANAAERPAPAVVVHTVAISDLTPVYKLVGRVEASEKVSLLARVSGFLEQQLFVEGRDVDAEQPLFQIEKNYYDIAVKQAQAELASARAALKNAEATLSRSQQLRKRQAVSQSQLDQAEADRDQARAQVLKTDAGLQKAKLDLSYTRIIAPFSGRIGKASYSVGDLVSPESGALATIVKLDPIYVEMSVSEKRLLDARRDGMDLDNPPVAPKLRLSDGSAYSHSGNFDFISPEVDRNTDTLTLRASFPNPKGLLLPGEFVHVEIKPKQSESGIRIPQSAVQRDRQGYYVMQVGDDSNVALTRVEMGPQSEGRWQVLKGLDAGDRVITEGLQKVKPGIRVTAVSAAEE